MAQQSREVRVVVYGEGWCLKGLASFSSSVELCTSELNPPLDIVMRNGR